MREWRGWLTVEGGGKKKAVSGIGVALSYWHYGLVLLRGLQ